MTMHKNVLVVDDDKTNLEIIIENLEGSGYIPFTAANGEIAWSMLEKEPEKYQAVLLDRMMPEMDGMEVLKRIRANKNMSMIPVIMQTAKATNDEVLEGLQAGAYYYLTKPFSKNQMIAIVKTAVIDNNKMRSLKEDVIKVLGTFSLMLKGRYFFRTLEEADILATNVVKVCPNPEKAVVGLSELLINAVEHGNLGLTYEDKSRLNESNQWLSEIKKRLTLPGYKEKKAILEVERSEDKILFTIMDEGNGFDWDKYMEISPERAFDTHGRGIAMSKAMSFNQIQYIGNGNTVKAEVHLE